MPSSRRYFRYSLVSVSASIVTLLAVAYLGLIAIVMSYAASTIEYSQSVRNDEASVAEMESKYFSSIADVTTTNYTAAGYVKPVTLIFVPTKNTTALR